jgi:hypothetical protein
MRFEERTALSQSSITRIKGGDPLLFQAIQEAYDVLGDETKRREYNAAFRKKPVESLLATATTMVDEYITAC